MTRKQIEAAIRVNEEARIHSEIRLEKCSDEEAIVSGVMLLLISIRIDELHAMLSVTEPLPTTTIEP